MPIVLSPMEVGILNAFHALYGDRGFPPVTEIRAKRRENTGAGRYVDIHSEAHVKLDDGYLDLEGRFIEMSGVPDGLAAVVLVKAHRIEQLEIAVYGDHPWDGEEREWRIA